MTERQQQSVPSDEQTTRLPPAAPAPVSAPPLPPLPATPVPVTDLRDTTLPLAPAPAAPAEDASILGFPAEVGGDEAEEEAEEAAPPQAPAGVPAGAGGLVVLRRPDRLAGILLLLAGVAAGASLWFPWVRRTGATGLTLARRAIDATGTGVGALGRSGLWQPLAVVLGGAVLFLLGLLLFRRARTHRLVGLLALLVAEAVTVGVVVLLAEARWLPGRIGPGLWLAVATAGLGLLGALKALLTGPRVTTEV